MRSTTDTPRLLHTPEQVAEATQVSRTQVYALLASGELQSVRIGRLRRIPDAALREFVDRLSGRPAGGDAA